MRGIVIIGGGLTGLSAAWELEQQGVEYTLIEVKPRLGGSILTRREGGFVMDGGAFALEKYGEWDFLDALGIPDALHQIGVYRDGDLVVFRDGTQTLIDALAARITQSVLTRMAVSSLGMQDNGRIGVCLENGLLHEARGVIVTAPARYAAHMLYSLSPEAALLLEDYAYDPVVRVHFGVRGKAEKPHDLTTFKFYDAFDAETLPGRVPDGHTLIRVGVRLNEAIRTPDDALKFAADALDVRDPVVAWAYYWAEADPLTRHLPEHAETMDALDRLLPPHVAIAGSDYRAKRLPDQVAQGRAAARRVVEVLT